MAARPMSSTDAPYPGGAPPVPRRPPSTTEPPHLESSPQLQRAPSDAEPKRAIKPLQWPSSNPYAQPDAENQIIFDTDDELTGLPRIKYATLDKLIERVTYSKYPDPNFLQSFMLTYRSFTSPKELLEKLIDRFHQPLPEGDPESVNFFAKSQQTPIRLRVFNMLKTWVQSHWHDFEDDKDFLQEFLNAVRTKFTVPGMESAGKSVEDLVHRALEGTEKEKQFVFTVPAPRSILPYVRHPKNLKLLELHPLEVARQLTLIEANMFRSIRPRELLNQSWNKSPDKAPNVLALIERFNTISGWVMTTIVMADKFDVQVKTIQHFIEIADKCRLLNNFNASMAIMAGFADSSVHRLKKHWSSLNPKISDTLGTLKSILSSDQNYKAFRAHLKGVELPCIPYLGMYLTDLTFIEDGNPNTTKDGLVNFFKRNLISQVIADIQQYQQTPYNLEEVKFIQFYLTDCVKVLDKEKCYQYSLNILPRGKKAEKEAVGWNAPAAYASATQAAKEQEEARKKAQTAAVQERREQVSNSMSTGLQVEVGEYGEMEYLIGYRFNQKDSDLNICFSGKDKKGHPQVSAGTIEKLVERLTHHKYPDTQFIAQFMMTYRTFTSAKTLMDLLIMRYSPPRPKDPVQLERFKSEKEVVVQFRIFNVFSHWVDKYQHEFASNSSLSKTFIDFLKAKAIGNSNLKNVVQQLLNSIRAYSDEGRKKPLPSGAPPPTFPLNRDADPDKPQLLDFHHEELARQMALASYEMIWSIHPEELLFTRENNGRPRASILSREQKREQHIQKWILGEMENQSGSDRLKKLYLLVFAGRACYDLRNFFDAVAIVHGIESPEVQALLSNVEQPPNTKIKLEELRRLVRSIETPNGQMELLSKGGRAADPFIPYLASFVDAITEIEDGEEDMLSNVLINFEKRRKLALILRAVAHGVSTPYNFLPIPWLQNLFAVSAGSATPMRALDIDAVRGTLRQQMALDPAMRQAVKDALKELMRADFDTDALARQQAEAKKYMRQHLGALAQRVMSVSLPELESALSQIKEQQFPGATSEEWTHDDPGHVYGWPTKISANLVHNQGQSFICIVRPMLDKSEIATLLRLKRVYEHFQKKQISKVVVVTGYVTEMAQNIANHLGVAIFCCRPQS
eukprot:TRINITY_DN1486_c0_g1_i1.p1 TRINITY_DN1486_c0_g1~~TRINITY_DN1486_c0_g1_i1.p1  ORF type:complete len:1136 (+),score=369.66 TRINITY_DN1486_c0_g1_i1:225-3632(+)